MKKYTVSEYKYYSSPKFHCLYRIDQLYPIEYNDYNVHFHDYSHVYNIKKVLVGNEQMKFKKIGKNYLWSFADGIEDFNIGLFEKSEGSILLEFEDDDSARLWFRLEYGV